MSDLTVFAGGALTLRVSGGIATLEINQPARRNAISSAMWLALPKIAAAIEAEEAIRVVLVQGAGGQAFSAGADISEFAEVYADPARTTSYNAAVRAGQLALRDLARPTIAVIRGVCIGGGCGVALACDLRFATTDARFAITPAKLGLAYSFADTAQLVEKVGPARAKDILFSGRMIEAAEALAIGLIDRIAAPAGLDRVAADYAANLSSLSQTSLRAAKAMINAIGSGATPTPGGMAAIFEASFTGTDFQEGVRAFLAKRRPDFR